jgi:hypothetical protein
MTDAYEMLRKPTGSDWRSTKRRGSHDVYSRITGTVLNKLPTTIRASNSHSHPPPPFRDQVAIMKYIFVALSGLLSLALAAPSQLSARETLQQATDRLLFSTSITGFETARTARNPAGLDWTSDGCSDSPDNPFGFDFIFSCHRHVRSSPPCLYYAWV